MSPTVFLRWMMRESRGSRGRMLYFVACLAIGVAAVVGAAALSGAVEIGFQEKSRELLGGDLTVNARRALPDELGALLQAVPGTESTDLIETATMARTGEGHRGKASSRLVSLVAVSGRYPLYGSIVTDPPGGLAEHLAEDTVVPAKELLATLDLAVGDDLVVGGRSFRVAAAVVSEPPQFGFSALLGPRVYLATDGFAQTGLIGFGSRARYRSLFALAGNPSRAELDQLRKRIEKEVPGAAYLDVDTHYEAGPGGRRTFRRVEGFVGLVALLSLVVGGIGVAQIVRTWTESRTGAIAVLRCIGLRPREILILSLGHVLLLALVGSLIGAAVGCLLPTIVAAAAEDLLPGGVVARFPLGAILRGLGLGVGLALVFSLPPLTAVWRVPPARVLRADADPLPPNRLVATAAGAALLVGIFGAAWVQAGELKPAAWFTGGFVALVTLLVLVTRGLMKLASRMPRSRLNPYVRHGVAALARPGSGTTGAVVALGLGTMALTSMWLVETRIRDAVLAQVPAGAPTVFLIDIQPTQWDDVQALLARTGAENVDQVPVVVARISEVDGRSIDELAEAAKGAGGMSRRALTREQRLTWREGLTTGNELVAGELWSDPERPEVSVEQRFAERIGVDVGSDITFDVQGVPLTTRVTSLRVVEWQSLAINFFLVLEPGALEGAPALYLANARVPEESEQELQDLLAERHPNVTFLRVRPLLDQILGVVERLVSGLGLLGWFIVAAGLMILAGAVAATALRRGREVALLKTLGVTRSGVVVLLAIEYGLSGLLAGAVGAGGAVLLAWSYLRYVAELELALPLWIVPAAAIGCAILTATCGVLASARSLAVRPIEALR